jgi:hypothetical protein
MRKLNSRCFSVPFFLLGLFLLGFKIYGKDPAQPKVNPVIAEVALFRLSKSSFEFDPVFKAVPTLPVLNDSDYLQVR